MPRHILLRVVDKVGRTVVLYQDTWGKMNGWLQPPIRMLSYNRSHENKN